MQNNCEVQSAKNCEAIIAINCEAQIAIITMKTEGKEGCDALVLRRAEIESRMQALCEEMETLTTERETVNTAIRKVLPPGSQWLDEEIDWSALPTRIRNALRQLFLIDDDTQPTYRELTFYSAQDLRILRGIGHSALSVIEHHLESLGLNLHPNSERNGVRPFARRNMEKAEESIAHSRSVVETLIRPSD